MRWFNSLEFIQHSKPPQITHPLHVLEGVMARASAYRQKSRHLQVWSGWWLCVCGPVSRWSLRVCAGRTAQERGVSPLLMVDCSLLVCCAEFALAGDLYPIISICMYVFVREMCCAAFVLAGDLYRNLCVTLFLTFFTIITAKYNEDH